MASKKFSVAAKPGLDPVLPKVPVTVDGVTYNLVYDFNAIALAEAHTGLNLFSSFDFRSLSVVKFRAMLWSSLIAESPEMTIEEAGRLVTFKTLPALTVGLIQAWTDSRPEVEEAKGNADAEAAPQSVQLELPLS